MIKHWADTSAILHWDTAEAQVAISPLTLSELEHIKTAEHTSQELKYHAREAIRKIIDGNCYSVITPNNRKIDKMLKKYNFLSDINDHRILCAAELYAEECGQDVIFMTCDATQYTFALQMPHLLATYALGKEPILDEWCGWAKYYPNDTEMSMLYSDPKINILKAKTNEFCEIYSNNELKDILFWSGHEFRPLKYKEMKNPYLNEVLKPRNLEQKMAFDLLQNKNIRVKLLTSAWGGGKTLMALTYALEQVGKGNFKKLVFIRNNIIVANTNDVGFLPGTLREKMSIWGGPLMDHLGGQDMLDSLIDSGIIEIFPLSHIRGRSIRDTIVICDECENMDDKLVTLLMSRIEEGSELIFCGDVAQIDSHKFEQNNGIRSMISHLNNDPLFGMVKLLKSERGPVAALCDKMRPPV
jgi:PhoH-like ATPase